MSDRPSLNKQLDSAVFREYYYLKEELIVFCRQNGLPVSGSKDELTERIAFFLDTGNVLLPDIVNFHRKGVDRTEIEINSIIGENFKCSEKHRAFFMKYIGKSFSFNVQFQKWLKTNPVKTYGEAIEAYYTIIEEKKHNKSPIEKQFEYNTYIRDFFADNAGKTLDDAIKCWKYKKSRQGHNRYERSDLSALEQ